MMWPIHPMQPSHITWRIKPTTFCNLRCRYCYEWNRLGDPQRLSLSQWRAVLNTAAEHRHVTETRLGRPVGLHIVIQGGEPLLLPLDYLQHAAALCREILGNDLVLGILTNLTVARPETLAWIARDNLNLCVSWDGVSGLRLDLAGRPTHQAVLASMEALSQFNIPFGVNLVLGAHNRDHLPAIHDRLASLGALWLSVIPMFHGAAPDATPPIMLSQHEIDVALARLYDHWLAQGRQLAIAPFTHCLHALDTGLTLSALPAPDSFTVHPDGSITAGTADTSRDEGFLSRLLDYIGTCQPDDLTITPPV